MKLSLDWLKQYVDIGGRDPEEIAYRLTMATAEVEEVEELSRIVEGVVVGKITAVEPIEPGGDGKSMNFVTVDTGGETTETVCGAPNVETGMNSAFAPPGTRIAGGLTVREQKLYGRVSRGILLSPLELGWGESHAGILSFPRSLKPGTGLAGIVPDRDHVIDIDNKSITHRPDLWGHYGFARELAAIYDVELKPLGIADDGDWKDLDGIPLVIEDLEGCPGYCCLDIGGLSRDFSPLELQWRLLSVGLRPINLLVDLTNYIMLELGQPMHAFDGERVRDIIVAPFGRRGTFTTLDSIERSMLPEDLMIKDHTGPIALAGIMGGEESEIREETTRVLLESANFNPSRIRRTALRLGLRSDASIRFEKGQPPYHMGVSIRRFVRMLLDAGQKPVVSSRLTCAGDTGETPRTLSMKADYISRTIGMEIPQRDVVKILHSLEFGCEGEGETLYLTIPPHRSARDISIPNDIVEEVARVYGYDNITPAMPEMELHEYTFNTDLQRLHKIRRFLSVSRGYVEAYTYSWYDDTWLKSIGYDPGETLTLQNPAAENNTRMRRELMPNLLALVEANAAHRDRFSIYEVGNVHHPDGEKGARQMTDVAGISFQSAKLGSLQDLFLAVKGTVEELCGDINAGEPEFTDASGLSKPWQVGNACMDIRLDGKAVGQIGFLTGRTFGVFDRDTTVVWFEIVLDELGGGTFPDLTYTAIPVYPGSWMDFSVLADRAASYADVERSLASFTHPILRDMKYQYHYQGAGLPDGSVSYTFRCWLGLRERTLNGDDLSEFRETFIAHIERQGLVLRK